MDTPNPSSQKASCSAANTARRHLPQDQAAAALPVPGALKAPHPRLTLATHAAAIVFGVTTEDLLRPSRGPQHIAFARQVAMYVSHVILRQSLVAVGRAFGRDRTTAAYACKIVENARDDPKVDERVSLIETLLVKARTPGRRAPQKRKG